MKKVTIFKCEFCNKEFKSAHACLAHEMKCIVTNRKANNTSQKVVQ